MLEYCIWWLSGIDCDRIPEDIEEQLPAYICKEVRSLRGRNGRGRLWVPSEIPIEEIDWDITKPMAAEASKAGGIVIKKEDVKHVACLPGFITDTSLNLWTL